jgi:hypothetical protein
LSAGLLACSVIAVFLNARAQLGSNFWSFGWVHVAVIISGGYATVELRRLSRMSPPLPIPSIREIFSRPIIAAGAIAVIAAAPNWSGASMYAGLESASGAPITHMSVHEAGGRYYADINRETEREVTKAQFDEFQQSLFSVFARVWVLLSLLSLCLWHVVVLRRSMPPTPEQAGTIAPSLSSETTASTGGKSGAVIAGIWLLVFSSSILVPLLQPNAARCNLFLPSEQPPQLVLLFPVLFFGGFALFTKRSPFFSPWLQQIIDRNYGLNFYEQFLVRLKPMLLFGIASVVSSLCMAFACGKTLEEFSRAMSLTFGVAAGLAFVVAHIVMRLRKVRGV